jgi:DNA-binding PadR family transcriptional regulator
MELEAPSIVERRSLALVRAAIGLYGVLQFLFQKGVDSAADILHHVKHMPGRQRSTEAGTQERGRGTPTLGDFEQLVLFSLARLGDGTYGALIRRDIEARTGRDLSISAVYVTLDRLQIKGLVRMYVGEPTAERGGRRRKHVELLPAGARAAARAYRNLKLMTEGLERRFKTT